MVSAHTSGRIGGYLCERPVVLTESEDRLVRRLRDLDESVRGWLVRSLNEYPIPDK